MSTIAWRVTVAGVRIVPEFDAGWIVGLSCTMLWLIRRPPL